MLILVGHLLLFHPAIVKIKELIGKGKIGKLQYMYSNRLNLGQVRTEENVFWSFAPHDISIFQYLNCFYPNKITSKEAHFFRRGYMIPPLLNLVIQIMLKVIFL